MISFSMFYDKYQQTAPNGCHLQNQLMRYANSIIIFDSVDVRRNGEVTGRPVCGAAAAN